MEATRWEIELPYLHCADDMSAIGFFLVAVLSPTPTTIGIPDKGSYLDAGARVVTPILRRHYDQGAGVTALQFLDQFAYGQVLTSPHPWFLRHVGLERATERKKKKRTPWGSLCHTRMAGFPFCCLIRRLVLVSSVGGFGFSSLRKGLAIGFNGSFHCIR